MTGAAAQNGMSFGPGAVTVAGSALKAGPRTYQVGDQDQTATLRACQRSTCLTPAAAPTGPATRPGRTARADRVPADPAGAGRGSPALVSVSTERVLAPCGRPGR